MAKQSRCEDCMNYVYDEEYDCYTCEQGAELDEEQTRALEPVPEEDEPVILPEPVPEPEQVRSEQDAPRSTLRAGGAESDPELPFFGSEREK